MWLKIMWAFYKIIEGLYVSADFLLVHTTTTIHVYFKYNIYERVYNNLEYNGIFMWNFNFFR